MRPAWLAAVEVYLSQDQSHDGSRWPSLCWMDTCTFCWTKENSVVWWIGWWRRGRHHPSKKRCVQNTDLSSKGQAWIVNSQLLVSTYLENALKHVETVGCYNHCLLYFNFCIVDITCRARVIRPSSDGMTSIQLPTPERIRLARRKGPGSRGKTVWPQRLCWLS